MKAAAFICMMLIALEGQAKQYQPSPKVLEQMMEIELERYQHKFGGPEKIAHKEEEVHHELNLAQSESLVEATIDQVSEKTEKPYLKRNISNAYGARAGYIANTLQNSSEYIHYILLWAVVFSAVVFALNKITKESQGKKSAAQKIEEAFTDSYSELAAPKSNSEV